MGPDHPAAAAPRDEPLGLTVKQKAYVQTEVSHSVFSLRVLGTTAIVHR